MSGSFTETTIDHRTARNMPCNMEMGPLAEAARGEDKELAAECSDLINKAFSVQAEVMEKVQFVTERKIAELESKWADALVEKERLEEQLKTENLRSYEFQNESGKISGRLQQANHRLAEHVSTRKKFIASLTSPSTVQQWEVKRKQLQTVIDEAMRDQSNLQLEVNEFNSDLEKIAYKLRVTIGNAQYLFNRIQQLKGSKEPILNAPGSHGLAS